MALSPSSWGNLVTSARLVVLRGLSAGQALRRGPGGLIADIVEDTSLA